MRLAFYLALFLCASIHCDDVPTDEEIEVAFQEIEDALNDRKEIKSMIKDVKDSMTSRPNYKKNALGIAKALSAAVPKLKSSNGYTIAQGALSLAAGIAENIPGGTVIASVATLIASVIGIIDSEKTDKIRDTMTEVLQEARDEDLAEEVDGFKSKINSLISAMNLFVKKDVKSGLYPFIAVKTEHASTAGLLPKLKSRILKHRKSKIPSEARRAFDFSVMYAQLVTLEELALTQVIFLLEDNNPEAASIYANSKNEVFTRSRKALSFWNNPNPEHAGCLVHYYPLGSSKSGKFLREFLQHIKVPESEQWNPASYVLISVKWPTYHLAFTQVSEGYSERAEATLYLSFVASTPASDDRIVFRRRPDGYFTIRSMDGENGKEGLDGGFAYLGSTKSPYYVYGENRHRGEDEKYQFIVISYPGTDIVTISCRNWPHKFFGGEKSKFSVILQDGNIGTDIQFYAHPCLREKSGKGKYRCPEYRIKTG